VSGVVWLPPGYDHAPALAIRMCNRETQCIEDGTLVAWTLPLGALLGITRHETALHRHGLTLAVAQYLELGVLARPEPGHLAGEIPRVLHILANQPQDVIANLQTGSRRGGIIHQHGHDLTLLG